jgi:hypothetical protein
MVRPRQADLIQGLVDPYRIKGDRRFTIVRSTEENLSNSSKGWRQAPSLEPDCESLAYMRLNAMIWSSEFTEQRKVVPPAYTE